MAVIHQLVSGASYDKTCPSSDPAMLRTLLSPIRARFDLSNAQPLPSPRSPRSPHPLRSQSRSRLSHLDQSFDEGDDGLEDFARDVMVELMRSAVETLKTAEDVDVKTEVRVSPPTAPSPLPSCRISAHTMLTVCRNVAAATTRLWRRFSAFWSKTHGQKTCFGSLMGFWC